MKMSKIVLTLICISILLGMTACSTKNVEDEDGQYFVSQTGYAGITENIETNDSKKYVSDMTEDELVDFLSKYTEYDTLSDYLRNRMLGYLKSQMFQLDHPGDADIPYSSTEYIDFTKQIKEGLKEYYGGEIPVHEVIKGFVTVFDEPAINISTCNSFYNISLTKDEVSTIRNAIDEVEWREDGLAEHPEFYYDGYIIFLSYGKCDQYYFSVQQGIVYYDHYYGALKDTDVAYIKEILEISENGK